MNRIVKSLLVAAVAVVAISSVGVADMYENLIVAKKLVARNTLKAKDVDVTGTIQIDSGAALAKHLTTTATIDFASAATNVCSTDVTATLTGVEAGDLVMVTPPEGSVNAGSHFEVFVSDDDEVTVRHCNSSGSANDPASGSYRITALGY